MPTSFNDDTYMTTMGVGSNNSHCSQTNEVHEDDHEFEVDEDGEGIVDAPKGRAGNYTMEEDILLCNTWLHVFMDANVGGDQSRDAYWIRMKEHFDLHNTSGIDRMDRSLRSRWSTINKDCQRWAVALKAVDTINPSGTNDRDRLPIAQNLFQGEEKKTEKGKVKKGRPFVFAHCYNVLKDEEKWKPCDDQEESKKSKATIDLDDEEEEASSDGGKRSPTPNSIAYSKPKRPNGGKKDAKEKKKKKNRGDDDLKNAMEAIVKARKEANEVRMMARSQDAAAEERRLAAEERRVASEERKVTLKEKKLTMEERSRLLEWEKYLFFMDTSNLDDKQKEYVNLSREEVLVQKRAMAMGGMGATMGGMGGMGGLGGFGATMGGMGAPTGGMGGMGGFGATLGGMGGMGGFGATMGGMGGMSFGSLMGGMGAPPGDMGGCMSSGVPHIPSHDAIGDLANTIRAPDDDAALQNEEEEEESSSDEEEQLEEEEDDDDVA